MTTDVTVEGWLAGGNLTLPAEPLARYWRRVAEGAAPEVVERHREELERTGHRALFAELFGEERLYARSVNLRTLGELSAFSRGAADLERAARRGVHLHELMRPMLAITDELLGGLLRDDDFAAPPKRICEVGGAWGATIAHLTRRFAPLEYRNYEIDAAYAAWAEKELGARAMPCDGESLAGTDDASMDLVVANNVLFFVPPIKAYRYLTEMARVLAPGGVLLFNAVLADRLSEAQLQGFLDDWFPRRAFGFLPQRFLDLALPEASFVPLRTDDTHPGRAGWTYHVYRRRRFT